MYYTTRSKIVTRFLAYHRATNPPGTQPPDAKMLIHYTAWLEGPAGFRVTQPGESAKAGQPGDAQAATPAD
jgi:hypothetical protein